MKKSYIVLVTLLVTQTLLLVWAENISVRKFEKENNLLKKEIESVSGLQSKLDSMQSENDIIQERLHKYDMTLSILEDEDSDTYSTFIKQMVMLD